MSSGVGTLDMKYKFLCPVGDNQAVFSDETQIYVVYRYGVDLDVNKCETGKLYEIDRIEKQSYLTLEHKELKKIVKYLK